MFQKKNFLWIILFGSLIGLNETLVGSYNMPYRSVILSSTAIALLSYARLRIPKSGTSLLIILIAILYKVNNLGFHTCTMNALLCGPTALVLMGVGYEIFALIFLSPTKINSLNFSFTCTLTAFFAFGLFAILNTYIIGPWGTDRLFQYILIKAPFTAIASSAITSFGRFSVRKFRSNNSIKLNPFIISSVLSIMIIALWLFGTYAKF